jgi:hypothetical protein
MPDEKKQPHWDNDDCGDAWLENTHHKDWASFSEAMLASSTCPSDYDDGYLRRQIGLLRYQFANAGFDAPNAPAIPETRSKKPKAQTLAEKLGLKANPDAIKPYEEAKRARDEAKKNK